MQKINKKPSLLKQLASGRLQLNPLWKKHSYRAKFLLRSYLIYPETLSWLDTLSTYQQLDEFLKKQTNLPCKLQRPYLANNMKRKTRFDALRFHYDFISSFSSNLVHHLYNQESIKLATIQGKNDQKIVVYIESNDKFSREGELTISVCNNDNDILATVTFAIIQYQQKTTLFIGGIQGSNHNEAKTLIQMATKTCYGAFPKNIAIEAAFAFAHFLDIENIVAVSNQTHIYNNWRYHRKNKKRLADYDSYWQTLQSAMNADKYYQLPIILERKSADDVPSKKRSEYRNKYNLLDQLSHDIQTYLLTLK